jgi:2-polyprenyl-3-methyl-5-hydroxy-6-metoxy-1,4-benzoquinol methylase
MTQDVAARCRRNELIPFKRPVSPLDPAAGLDPPYGSPYHQAGRCHRRGTLRVSGPWPFIPGGGRFVRDPSRIRSETYCYATGTHGHPRRLFRFSHLRRFDLAVRLLEVDPGSRVLDFGSGDGYLVERLLPLVPPEKLVALEPMPFLQEQFRKRLGASGVSLVERAEDLPSGGFDRIACLEVLEHLREPDVTSTCDRLEGLLAPGGVLVISVPLEIGPSALAKYAAARVLTRMDRWYTLAEVLQAAAGRSVPRDAEGSFLSHRGYDHRKTRRELERRFVLEREVFSPLPWLRGVLNAQVFWRLRRREG